MRSTITRHYFLGAFDCVLSQHFCWNNDKSFIILMRPRRSVVHETVELVKLQLHISHRPVSTLRHHYRRCHSGRWLVTYYTTSFRWVFFTWSRWGQALDRSARVVDLKFQPVQCAVTPISPRPQTPGRGYHFSSSFSFLINGARATTPHQSPQFHLLEVVSIFSYPIINFIKLYITQLLKVKLCKNLINFKIISSRLRISV